MELLALGTVLFHANNCCFRKKFSNEISLCPTKASSRLSVSKFLRLWLYRGMYILVTPSRN